MSHFEFAIPLQKDELLESHAGKYHVEDVVQPRLLLSQLQGKFCYIHSDAKESLLKYKYTKIS